MRRLLLALLAALSSGPASAGPPVAVSPTVPLPLAISNGGTASTTGLGSQTALSGVYVVGQSAAANAVTGTTSETVLATCAIPAGAMGANARVRITTAWSYPNNANTKTVRIRFGTASGSGFLIKSVGLSTTAVYSDQTWVANVNATNAQKALPNGLSAGLGSTTAGMATQTGVQDTATSPVVISMIGLLGVSTDTLTLEGYLCELMAGSGS